jgi:hypothetical protein
MPPACTYGRSTVTSDEFERREYEEVARKLDSLSPRERALLLEVLSAARIHVRLHVPEASPDDPEPTVADLQQQILNAFIPGDGTDLVVYSRIGHDPMLPPPCEPQPDNSDEPRA